MLIKSSMTENEKQAIRVALTKAGGKETTTAMRLSRKPDHQVLKEMQPSVERAAQTASRIRDMISAATGVMMTEHTTEQLGSWNVRDDDKIQVGFPLDVTTLEGPLDTLLERIMRERIMRQPMEEPHIKVEAPYYSGDSTHFSVVGWRTPTEAEVKKIARLRTAKAKEEAERIAAYERRQAAEAKRKRAADRREYLRLKELFGDK